MPRPPKCYRNAKRPPLAYAAAFEGGTIKEAIKALEKKGYFEPPPRPWQLGVWSRGMGRESFAILDRFGDVVVKEIDQSTAELIISAVNAYKL